MAFLKTPAARRFIATLAATATAFALMTAAAVPARADRQSDNFAKAIAAVAAIAIIGSALNEDKDKRRDHHTTLPQKPRVVESTRGYHRDYFEPQRHRRAAVLPAQCAIEVRGRRSSGVAYTERCLRRAGVDQRLPRQCEVSLGRKGRDLTAYDQNCLLNSGFRTQGRGRH